MSTSILSQNSPIIPNIAAVLSIFIASGGLNAILRPRSGLEIFGLPPLPEPEPEQRKLAHNLTRLYGVRQMAMGLSTLAVWWCGRSAEGAPGKAAFRRALGLAMLAQVGVPVVDGWAIRMQIGKDEWRHWVFAPLVLVLGGALLA